MAVVDREHGFPCRPRTYEQIERIARVVRGKLLPDASDVEAVRSIEVFERLDDLAIGLDDDREIPVDYAVRPLPRGLEGLSMYDEEHGEIVVALDPETYLGLVHGAPRALFCLCHELGHVCVHTESLIDLSHIPHGEAAMHRGEVPRHRPFEDTEWQANAFAAAFTMPATGLEKIRKRDGILTPVAVQRAFGVSFEAARIRIDVFGTRRRGLL